MQVWRAPGHTGRPVGPRVGHVAELTRWWQYPAGEIVTYGGNTDVPGAVEALIAAGWMPDPRWYDPVTELPWQPVDTSP